jgi:hypothetical protein
VSETQQQTMREVVLPLAVVIGLIVNALLVGTAWGRLGQRLDTNDAVDASQTSRIEKSEERLQTLRDTVRDLSRDAQEDRKNFLQLEDYSRGRIDRLPYHSPPTRR